MIVAMIIQRQTTLCLCGVITVLNSRLYIQIKFQRQSAEGAGWGHPSQSPDVPREGWSTDLVHSTPFPSPPWSTHLVHSTPLLKINSLEEISIKLRLFSLEHQFLIYKKYYLRRFNITTAFNRKTT